MASTSQGAALTEAHRQQQQQVRAAFLAEFLALWPLLDSTRLDETGPGWVRAVLPLVRRYRAESARVASVYFDEFRLVEAPTAVARPRVLVPGRVAPEVSRPALPSRPAAPTPAAPSLAPDRAADGGGRRRARVQFDDSAFNLPDRRRARIEVPELDWAREDRAVVVSLTVTGPGGHTARPHLTTDVVYALGRLITDLPGLLSRRIDPRAAVSLVWGAVNAGVAPNARQYVARRCIWRRCARKIGSARFRSRSAMPTSARFVSASVLRRMDCLRRRCHCCFDA